MAEMNEQRAREILGGKMSADDLLLRSTISKALAEERNMESKGPLIFLEGIYSLDELEAIAWLMRRNI
jgi:hypothetical protein